MSFWTSSVDSVKKAIAQCGEAAMHANELDELIRRHVVGVETPEKSGIVLRTFMNETGTKVTVKRTPQGKLYIFSPQALGRSPLERWRLFLEAAGVAYHMKGREAWLPSQQILLQFMPEMPFPGNARVNARAEYLAEMLGCYVDVIYGEPGQANPFDQRYFVKGYNGTDVPIACFSATKGIDGRVVNVSIGVCKAHCGLVFSTWICRDEHDYREMLLCDNHGCTLGRDDDATACMDDSLREGNRCMAVAVFG